MNENNNKKKSILLIVIFVCLSLIIGACVGYYYGKLTGINIGKQVISDRVLNLEQQILNYEDSVETNLEEIQEVANPFSKMEEVANPYKDTYENPFE